MRREKVKDVFTAAASDVADEFYPKGDKRRGEFIRDAGVLYVKLQDQLDKFVESRKRKPIAMRALMLAEDVMEYFEDTKEGIASDLAWYELVEMCEMLFAKTLKAHDFTEYLCFTFGFNDDKEVIKLKEKSHQRFVEMNKIVNGS